MAWGVNGDTGAQRIDLFGLSRVWGREELWPWLVLVCVL